MHNNTPGIEISIIAPMYNEADNVDKTFRALLQELNSIGQTFEVIFVNDGSTDNTVDLCRRLQAEYPQLKLINYFPNVGRGRALKEGFKAAQGQYVFTIDFDLTYKASHISQMYNYLRENPLIDIVLVSAYMEGGRTIGVDPKRLLISKLGNTLLSYVFPQKVYTSTCVVRGYKNEVVKSLCIDSDDKEIHLEILSKAFALGYKIREIPGVLERRKAGKSSFRLKATSQSHLIFLLTEKPAFYFRVVGFLFFLLSTMSGVVLFSNRIFSLGTKYPFLEIISPALVIYLFLIGVLFAVVSILALLFSDLRREMIKVQAMLLRRNYH